MPMLPMQFSFHAWTSALNEKDQDKKGNLEIAGAYPTQLFEMKLGTFVWPFAKTHLAITMKRQLQTHKPPLICCI